MFAVLLKSTFYVTSKGLMQFKFNAVEIIKEKKKKDTKNNEIN